MRDLVPPTRFELLDCIGRGGIAEVFRANQIGLRGFRRRVAIKQLLPDLAGDERHRERLIHEARIGATLEHPNIVQTLDLIFLNNNPAIVLELIDGHDLFALLSALARKKVELPIELGVHIAVEILHGLGHAIDVHGPTLVHGDVTPGNIMVSRHGGVRLIDFGVASATVDAAMRGKPGYLSPEIVRGEPPDHRSDLFALATTLWESLTLRRLFVSSDEQKTLDNVRNVRISKRFSRPGRVPTDLLDLLQRALAIDPADRFQTAQEFARALNGWLIERGVVVTRDALINFVATHGPTHVRAPSAMEPPPLPASPPRRVEPKVGGSGFSALARGLIDEALARIAATTPSVAAERRPVLKLGPIDGRVLPSIVAALWRGNLTGALTLTDGTKKKVLYFSEGGLVQVHSNIDSELLGHRLVDAGTISGEVPEIALRYARAQNIRIGDALIELQATSPETLARALDEQLAARFIEALTWTNGRLTFEGDRHPSDEAASLAQLDTLTLIFRGLRENWSDHYVADLLAPLAETTLYWLASRLEVSRALFLGVSDDERLMRLDDGERLGDRASEGAAMRFLIAVLIALGFIRVTDPPRPGDDPTE
jgi:serine/threonine-protein kinase